jgi:hypothetical protein
VSVTRSTHSCICAPALPISIWNCTPRSSPHPGGVSCEGNDLLKLYEWLAVTLAGAVVLHNRQMVVMLACKRFVPNTWYHVTLTSHRTSPNNYVHWNPSSIATLPPDSHWPFRCGVLGPRAESLDVRPPDRVGKGGARRARLLA